MRTLVLSAVTAAIFVSGCSNFANRGAVYRETDVNNGATLILDAEQNALVNINRGDYQVICSQPAPDTSAADSVSAAIGAELADGQEAQLGYAAGQAVSNIGLRTQSIQLLRDSFFRLCEAYQNGGVDDIEYGINLRRIQNTMIAVMAVEQLTGATMAGTGSAQSGGTASADGPDSGASASTSGSATATAASSTPQSSEAIADAVQTITLAAITQDYSLYYCMDLLRFRRLASNNDLYPYCTQLVANDLMRQQQRSETADRVVTVFLDNPDMPAGQREALMAILANIAADGDFRGLTQLIVPPN